MIITILWLYILTKKFKSRFFILAPSLTFLRREILSAEACLSANQSVCPGADFDATSLMVLSVILRITTHFNDIS